MHNDRGKEEERTLLESIKLNNTLLNLSSSSLSTTERVCNRAMRETTIKLNARNARVSINCSRILLRKDSIRISESCNGGRGEERKDERCAIEKNLNTLLERKKGVRERKERRVGREEKSETFSTSKILLGS